MKFKSTLLISVILHISLAVLFMIPPARKNSGEMTYYVDLVQLGGGGGGGGGGGKTTGSLKQETPTQAALIEEKGGGVKNLTVEKKFQSPLRFPDKESKKTVEDNKMISVVRKERTIAKSETPIQGTVIDQGLKTGISSGGGGGGGSGDGNGWGGGPGGPGGYFPHAYYIDLLRNRISSSWYSSLVAPGLKGKHITGVYFIVRRNGEISDLRVERPSGVSSLDLSARRAIENAAPFAPLPNDFSSQYLVVHFEFEWEK
ncbi:MAG: TonB C-terminal domain-containing protein [Candidatus Aminicenantes bacterium]|nr:TonB C-terminal domain-containing protein [Candidatus Aminicenantes bacterium]